MAVKNQDTKGTVSDKTKKKPEAAKSDKGKEAKQAKPSADAKAAPAVKNPSRNRLKKFYTDKVAPELMNKFKYKSVMQVPRLEKITLNMRLGDVKDNSKSFNIAVGELAAIAGQKPVITKAKKSVANFKVREGMNLGAKVTLRGEIMYEFFDKLVSLALPRVRDFRGVTSKSFDGRGNYALGIKEQLIFPEINYDQVEKVRGFDIVCVTSAQTDEEARELLKLMGMPFKAD